MVRVEFVNDGIVCDVEKGAKLLDVARDNGSSVPFGCTNGICGTCVIKVLSKPESLSLISEREKQTLEMFGALDGKHRLACQCTVIDDVRIDNP